MAHFAGVLEDFPDDNDFDDFMEGMKAQQAALDDLLKRSDELPEGEIVGGVLRWQRGDGYAFYVVTEEEPLTVAWVPFMDHWTVEDALIRGLNKDDVLEKLAQARSLRSIFGG